MSAKLLPATPKYKGDIDAQLKQWRADGRICAECGFPINQNHSPMVFDGKNVDVYCPTVYADNRKEVCPDLITGLKSKRKMVAGGKAKISVTSARRRDI